MCSMNDCLCAQEQTAFSTQAQVNLSGLTYVILFNGIVYGGRFDDKTNIYT